MKYLYRIVFQTKDGRSTQHNPVATTYGEALTKAEAATGLKEGVDGCVLNSLVRGDEVHG